MENPFSSMSFQKIIDRIADAFSVFDFSYIISGGLTLLLVYMDIVILHSRTITLKSPFLILAIGLFLAYVCGLIVWVIGRFVRRCFINTSEDFKKVYNETKTALNLNTIIPITDEKVAYSYMWSRLQCDNNTPQIEEKLKFINKYWVMQALYEGLIGSGIIAILILLDYYIINRAILSCLSTCCIIGIFIFVVFLMFCFAKEARKYANTQIVDLLTLYYIYYHRNDNNGKEEIVVIDDAS